MVVNAIKRKRYTEEQIAFALRQAESGTAVEEICRNMGVSEPTFYRKTMDSSDHRNTSLRCSELRVKDLGRRSPPERLAIVGIEPSVGSVGDSGDCEYIAAARRA